MARLNLLKLGQLAHPRGAPARHIGPEMQLRRSVLACLLWENRFMREV
jgi:60 kDa SS-A/Ro ribonucleoprotein